ncbi:MAG: Hint domain-containing protein [Pseudomonadota bacterium]
MTLKFYAIDNEFATATGDNVEVVDGRSRFDNPPNESRDLVVSTKPGDDDPRLFEIGDTYDISWGGQGGGGTILDAVVVRSDPTPDGNGGGVIVFDGVDEDGERAQIVWTPDHNLEGWYNDNYNPSAEPQFHTEDQDAGYSHTFVCFDSGMLIDTPAGQVRVDALVAGDMVQTLDAGPCPILWVGRRTCSGRGAHAPVRFDPGSVGNTSPLILSRQHRVLIRSPMLELHLGEAEALAPACAFVALPGVVSAPCPSVTYVHLLLAAHHVITANGTPCETLRLGPQTRHVLRNDRGFGQALHRHGLSDLLQSPARPILSRREAERLLAMPGISGQPTGTGLPDFATAQAAPGLVTTVRGRRDMNGLRRGFFESFSPQHP